MGSVEIVEWRTTWALEFETLAAALREILADATVEVDHVGSTSVAGLPAKDVIDVQVTVPSDSALRETCERLKHSGYAVNPDGRDHIVPGAPDDPEQWRKGFASERPGDRRANIHIRVAGRPNQVYALLFRDYLRAHPITAQTYAQFKARAAALLPDDSATYAELKDPVCDLIYLPARVWADETGWQPPSR